MTGLGMFALMVLHAINGKLTPLVPYLTYGGGAALVIGLVGLALNRAGEDMAKGLEALAGLGSLALIMAGVGTYAPSLLPYFTPTPVTTFAQAVGASHRATEMTAKSVTITVHDQVVFGEREIIAITGRHVRAVGSWATESADQRLAGRDIVIDQHAIVKDQYGNRKQDRIYSVRWSFDDLRRMQWKNLSSDDVMHLGHVEPFVHMGLPIIRTWCAADKDRYSNLCSQFSR